MKKPLLRQLIMLSKRILYAFIIQLIFCTVMLANTGNAQRKTIDQVQVSVNAHEVALSHVFRQIERQTDFRFTYNPNAVPLKQLVNLEIEQGTVYQVLEGLIRQTDLSFVQINDNIHVKPLIKSDKGISIQEVSFIDIKGKVTDPSGQVLPGVTVIIEGSTTGTVTDVDGNYSISASEGDVLVFSFVGFESRKVTVGNQTVIDVQLAEDAQSLEEVVVVGFGTQKKVNLTGSVESLEGEELAKRPVMQASMTLQGMAPGVTVTQATGQPGADQGTIRIRGIGTLNNSNPLILIDGVPGDLNTIDPNDISNISVLKDAASAAIYGARAANGVVLVTTKRAKRNELQVNYNAYAGAQIPTRMPKYLDGLGYMTLLNEAYRNQGQDEPFTEQYINDWIEQSPIDPDNFPNTDWQKEVIKESASQQHHYLSVTGGSEKARLRASLGYMSQDGLIGNTGFERYSLRINSDMKISDKFDIGFDVYGTQSDRWEPNEGMFEVFYQINRASPLFVARHSDGSLGPGYNFSNPVAQTTVAGRNRFNGFQLFSNMRSSYRLRDDLKISLNFSPTYNFNQRKNFARKVDFFDFFSGDYLASRPEVSSLFSRYEKQFSADFQGLINYEKQLGDHYLSILLGYNYFSNRLDFLTGSRDGFVLPDYQELNAGSVENMRNNGSSDEWALRSYFARVNYDYLGKYLFEINGRYDGSSRFARNNRFGFFPSLSAGWNLAEEGFLSDNSWINVLKLRASWGQLGNQNVPGGNYPYQSFISFGQGVIFGNNLVDGAALLDGSNPALSWESTEMTNIGVDAELLDGLAGISFEYYNKLTNDIIFNLPIPATTGLTSPPVNAGVVRNRGWDLRMTHQHALGQFNYQVGFNLSDVKTTVEDLMGTGPIIDGFTILDEGVEFNSLFGLVAEGYFQTQEEIDNSPSQIGQLAPGDIKYQDSNQDGVINAEDRQNLGGTLPRYVFGLDFNATFRGFDFSFLFQGVGSRTGYLNQEAAWAFYNGGKVQEKHLDYWTPENPNAEFPRLTYSLTNNQAVSSFWKTDASYLRLKNVVLGYTLPKTLSESIKIARCRIYLSGQNVFSLDSYDGFDPESRLGNNNFYPFVSVYTAGLDVTF